MEVDTYLGGISEAGDAQDDFPKQRNIPFASVDTLEQLESGSYTFVNTNTKTNKTTNNQHRESIETKLTLSTTMPRPKDLEMDYTQRRPSNRPRSLSMMLPEEEIAKKAKKAKDTKMKMNLNMSFRMKRPTCCATSPANGDRSRLYGVIGFFAVVLVVLLIIEIPILTADNNSSSEEDETPVPEPEPLIFSEQQFNLACSRMRAAAANDEIQTGGDGILFAFCLTEFESFLCTASSEPHTIHCENVNQVCGCGIRESVDISSFDGQCVPAGQKAACKPFDINPFLDS